MKSRSLFLLLILPAVVALACQALTPSSEPGESTARKQVEIFVNPSEVTRHLGAMLRDMGIQTREITYRNNRVNIEMEQPANRSDEQVEILYLSTFLAASRAAPFSSHVNLIILIDGSPLIQMEAEMAAIRSFRAGKISEKEFVKKLAVSSP